MKENPIENFMKRGFAAQQAVDQQIELQNEKINPDCGGTHVIPSEIEKLQKMNEELLECLKDVLNHGLVYGNGEVHQANVERAKKAIEKAERDL
jgi:hypothetical protein